MDGIGGSHSLRDLLRHVLHEHRIGRQFEVRGEDFVRGRQFLQLPFGGRHRRIETRLLRRPLSGRHDPARRRVSSGPITPHAPDRHGIGHGLFHPQPQHDDLIGYRLDRGDHLVEYSLLVVAFDRDFQPPSPFSTPAKGCRSCLPR